MKKLPVIPAAFFGTILGVNGVGNAWRVGVHLWNLPPVAGECVLALGVVLWALLAALYIAKWIWLPAEAMAEIRHPVLCCFVGLVPLTAVLVAMALAPYSRPIAVALFALGATGQLAFGIYRTGQLWSGGRDPSTTTPVLYVPSVAGGFLSSIGASTLGFITLAPLFFGAGLFSWLALESVILYRLLTVETMPKPLRLTLGLMLAPPAVAGIGYLGITTGPVDHFAQFLIGYGIFQFLLLLRLWRWFHAQPFGAGYWAFSFGVTALTICLMRGVDRGLPAPYPGLAIGAFVFSLVFVGWLTVSSLWSLVRGTYLPPRLVPADP